MSTKTKRLSQLLFRRSSSSSGPLKPPRREICYQHQNQSHYENLMSVGFGLREIGHGPSSLKSRDDDKEEETEDESAPLIPFAIPQLVESKDYHNKAAFGRVLIFGDKPPSQRNVKGSRAKSSSPCRSNHSQKQAANQLPSILKNGNFQKNYFYDQNNKNDRNEEGKQKNYGKSTLQRTKSSPNPSKGIKSRSIPVEIPCPPKLKHSTSSKFSFSNPLLNLSWNCPTIEKRKETILNHFKKLNGTREEGRNVRAKSEPIYEEISEPSSNSNTSHDMNSLKPKISPKRVRLNLLPTYDIIAEDENFYQEPKPIYDKLLTRSSSFCSIPSNNNWTESEITTEPQASNSPNSQSTFARQWVQSADSLCNPVLRANDDNVKDVKIEPKKDETNNSEHTAQDFKEKLSIATFASQVAEHARHNRSRSNSFNFGLLSNSSNLVGSSFNHGLEENGVCDMDEIYLRLDKRGKKVGSSTTRLLKRHQSLAEEDFYINVNSIVSPVINTSVQKANIIMSDNIYANLPNNVGINENKNSEAKSSDSETESGFSLEEGEMDVVSIPRIRISCANSTSKSEDSCYSCTNSSNSSTEEGEEESESLQAPQHLNQHLLPARSLLATNKAKPLKKSAPKSNINHHQQKIDLDLVVSQPDTDFITTVSVEKNTADVFPHIESPKIKNSVNSVLTISVIDSTESNPISCIYPPYPVIETEAEKNLFLSHISNLNWDWYLSLKKGTVALDQSVTVIHQTPKKNKVGDFYPTDIKTNTANTINLQPQDNFPKIEAAMSTSAIMTPTSIKDDKLAASSGLLIETQNLWDTSSSPSPPSSSSPNSHSSEPELSSSSESSTTSSDLSEISVQLVTMTESGTRNKFIHQDSKYYDDGDEDGGFESFQVVDPDVENGYEDEMNSGSDENQGEFLGISDSAAHRQRTFAQLSQNIPEQELKLKASSVLDLINAEISDLHMRELELKKKNRVADGKEDENDSDLVEVEGSSQADSDDYSDSAVDVESYSRTSNSSGNVTPADRDKNQREGSGSPQSYRGEYHPADVEASEKEETLVEDQSEDAMGTSSSVMGISDGSPSSGTVTGKQHQGVKVRPIVEEEVKSIELSVTKETPIEREIRLVREREEEFKRLRSVPSVESDETAPTQAKEPEKKVVSRSSSSVETGKSAGPKDIQYEMATARLKREIEENNMRERELFREGRLKSLSAPEPQENPSSEKSEESGTGTPNSEEESSEIFDEPEAIDAPLEEEHNIKPSLGRRALIRIPSYPTINQTTPNFKTSSSPQSAPANSTSNSMRFFSPTGFSPTTPTSPTNSTQSLSFQNRTPTFSSSGGQSLSFSKAQFTSIERMILKGSFSFSKNMISEEPNRALEDARMAKVSMMPDPLQIVHRTESIDETDEGEVAVEEKPRRKYIQAQDKIQMELQEQSKREKELSQVRAKWKSTPDLSKSEDASDEVEDDKESLEEGEGLTKPSALKRQMSSSTQRLSISEDVSTTDVLRMNKPTVRRRHSALINQWEEMIKQQQQKNVKN